MATTELIIAEKPSAAKKVAEALAVGKLTKKAYKKVPYYEIKRDSQHILVASAVGHLFTLASKEKGWKYPIFAVGWKATHEVDKGAKYTKAYVELLQSLAKQAQEFTLACDYDIEGEVIGWNVLRFACNQKDGSRMKFSTLTKPDLVEAYEQKAKTIDWGQAVAGETRHMLDWFYGINLSRALTASVKAADAFRVMSIGRVQGPAVKMIVDRQRQIDAFKPTPYWELRMLAEAKKREFEAFHEKGKFWEENEATVIFAKIKNEKTALVKDVKKSQFEQAPPFPFDLTTLQTEAYANFGINPKETLELAQNLYLAGLISYPRTSSQQLTPKIGFKNIITQLSGQKAYEKLCGMLLQQEKLQPNNGKKTDPAHPALFPTGLQPEEALKPREEKIYDLIVKRFLATFGPAAVRETITILLDVKGEPFIAEGKRTASKGWHVFYAPYVRLEEAELPALAVDEKVAIRELNKLDKQTQPPRYYTPASIVKELERRNLGTKATRSEIIDTLYKRGYISGQQIQATAFGMQTVATLERYAPDILDEELTRHFEEEMEGIQEKKLKEEKAAEEEKVIKEAKEVLMKIIEKFKKNEKKIGEELLKAVREMQEVETTIGACMACNEGTLRIIKSKKTRKTFIACNKYPECETTFSLPQNALIKPSEEKCAVCNYPMVMVIRKAKRPQNVCINPKCASKQAEKGKEGQPCPRCNVGKIVVRRSFYGEFYACDKYPECRFTESVGKKGE